MRAKDARISSEDALVAAIAEAIARRGTERVLNPIGDDVALWQPSRSHRSVITTDASTEGVHFRRDLMTLHDAGYRAMAANLSDIAAAGARPVLATLFLGLPQGTAQDDALAVVRGVIGCASEFGCTLAGGDVGTAPAITISITVVGEVRATRFKGRAGARPGDVLAVTGPLGAARAGLKLADTSVMASDADVQSALDAFRRPRPCLAEGQWLAAGANVHAMMDLSDGIASDLPRLCERSGCSALIESLPVAAAASDDDALCGGDDYALLAAVAPRAFRHLAKRYAGRFGKPLIAIGRMREGTGVSVLRGGVEEPLSTRGYDHFAGASRA